MPLSEEHKAAMKAGRLRGAELRKLAKSTVGMAPGHERDEQVRINADSLAERIEENAEKLGIESIDATKLERDRETQQRVESMNEEVGGIQNPQPGYRYFRLPLKEAYRSDTGSHSAIRTMHADAKKYGAEPVREDMPEDARYRGNDHAAGSSLRGLADTVLYRIDAISDAKLQQAMAEKQRRQGLIEERDVVYARSRGLRVGGVAGDFSKDPLMAQLAGSAGREETFTHARPAPMGSAGRSSFSEGDLRRGSMHGPNGETLPPGFERLGR